jgi:hypothetical protein
MHYHSLQDETKLSPEMPRVLNSPLIRQQAPYLAWFPSHSVHINLANYANSPSYKSFPSASKWSRNSSSTLFLFWAQTSYVKVFDGRRKLLRTGSCTEACVTTDSASSIPNYHLPALLIHPIRQCINTAVNTASYNKHPASSCSTVLHHGEYTASQNSYSWSSPSLFSVQLFCQSTLTSFFSAIFIFSRGFQIIILRTCL